MVGRGRTTASKNPTPTFGLWPRDFRPLGSCFLPPTVFIHPLMLWGVINTALVLSVPLPVFFSLIPVGPKLSSVASDNLEKYGQIPLVRPGLLGRPHLSFSAQNPVVKVRGSRGLSDPLLQVRTPYLKTRPTCFKSGPRCFERGPPPLIRALTWQ